MTPSTATAAAIACLCIGAFLVGIIAREIVDGLLRRRTIEKGEPK